jgi:mevalonate pyrophosphate decarboxylase
LFPLTDKVSFVFVFAEKMKKDLGALVNAASRKLSAKKKRKDVHSLEHLIAGSATGSSSGPVVDLEVEEPSEELVQDSAKSIG